jgi:hypothetical protein
MLIQSNLQEVNVRIDPKHSLLGFEEGQLIQEHAVLPRVFGEVLFPEVPDIAVTPEVEH